MAGLSRSEYVASLQSQKTNKVTALFKILAMALILVFLPQLLLFALGFWIIIALLLGAVKSAVDIPEFM
jgi:hypothetical protein